MDKIIQCTDLADLEAFEAEWRTDWFGVSRDEERAFVELQNQFALRFQQLVLESKAFSSTTERLERLERQFDGLLLTISSLKAQRMTDASTSTNGVQMVEAGTETSFEPIASFKSLSNEDASHVERGDVKCVSAPSAPRGAPFCQVNPTSNELMRKTGISLRRGQPQSPSVLHWLVHTYYQACLTFLRQCPGVPFWHPGFFLGFEFFQWLIYISAMALPLQLPLALTLLSSGLFFGFAPNSVGCLLYQRHSVDSDQSLRWRVCPALEFCTVGVEVFALFFLCV